MVDLRSGMINQEIKNSQKLLVDDGTPKNPGDPETSTSFSWDTLKETKSVVKKRGFFSTNVIIPVVLLLFVIAVVVVGKVI